PFLVLHGPERDLVAESVVQFAVADAAVGFPDQGYNARSTFDPFTYRKRHSGADTHLLLPLRTDLGEVVCEGVSGAAAIGAMEHGDLLVGQSHVRIQLLQCRVIPGDDLAQKDVGQHGTAEDERFLDSLEVVHRYDGAHCERDVKNLATLSLRFFE